MNLRGRFECELGGGMQRTALLAVALAVQCCWGMVLAQEFRRTVAADDARLAAAKAQFDGLDGDRDGVLRPEEYVAPHVGLPTERAAIREAEEYDVDASQTLSLAEFRFTPRAALDKDLLLSLLDENNDGRVSWNEFASQVIPMGRQRLRADFFLRDFDGDATLTLTEYTAPSADWRPHLRSKYALLDLDDNGEVSLGEYVAPHVGKPSQDAADAESREYDADSDQKLSLQEFALTPHGANTPALQLEFLDADRDGVLTRGEFIEVRPARHRLSFEMQFVKLDLNGNNRLETVELLDPESVRTVSQLPQLAAGMWGDVQRKWLQADVDGNGFLTSTEWSDGAVTDVLWPQATQKLADFDLDRSGSISMEEMRRCIDAAFGVSTLSGKPLRFTDGVFVNWAFLRTLDMNGDQTVSSQEFETRYFAGEENPARFREFDSNGDGVLGEREIFEERRFAVDPAYDFCQMDADDSGRLSQQELRRSISPWQRRLLARVLRAFDDNGNSSLEFQEYQASPFGTPIVDWYGPVRDLDLDGSLSRQEFFFEHPINHAALCSYFFDRFDSNRDGRLLPGEFDCILDFSQLTPEVAFEALDRDANRLLNPRDLPDELQWDTENAAQFQQWLMQAEESLALYDADSNGNLSLQEFAAQPAPVIAAMTGKSLPGARTIAAAAGSAASAGSDRLQTQSSPWRLYLLVAFNVLVLGGVAWLLLARTR